MPRIPDEEIQRLKRQVSIVRLCERYGIELKPQGKNLAGFCPWHKEDKPSFIVTPDKNLWHCMGACDAGGDVFSLVMKAESVSFRQAAEILLEISGSIPASATVQTRSGTEHPILVKPEDDLSEPELLNHVTDFYHRAFLNDPKAMQYLEKRCCLHPEAVKRFKIGYANRTLGYRIPNTTADGQRLKQRLKALGIFRKSGHEHLSGSVVFPIFDIEGRPVQMYGRKITAGLRKGTPEHLYLEGPLKGIWNAEGIMHQKTWILCEAIIDALTLWTHGVRNVTCCFGKNTFTGDLWALMRKACPERVVIAFDNDAAGNQAAEKLAPKLWPDKGSTFIVSKCPGARISTSMCVH
jgi:DNA primase